MCRQINWDVEWARYRHEMHAYFSFGLQFKKFRLNPTRALRAVQGGIPSTTTQSARGMFPYLMLTIHDASGILDATTSEMLTASEIPTTSEMQESVNAADIFCNYFLEFEGIDKARFPIDDLSPRRNE